MLLIYKQMTFMVSEKGRMAIFVFGKQPIYKKVADECYRAPSTKIRTIEYDGAGFCFIPIFAQRR